MTIRKGEEWGQPGTLGPHGVVVRSDAEARAVVTAQRRASLPIPRIGLLGGDLCRTVGGAGAASRLHDGTGVVLPCDLGEVLLDGRLHWFVAHLVARRSWWRGRVFVAMNAEWLGTWDVAPRSHPNDGLLDTLETRAPLGERVKMRSRLPLGTHLPHPQIEACRVSAVQVSFDRPTPVWLDGEPVGSARNLSIRLEPDAWEVVV